MTDAITREEKLMEAIATGSPSNIKPITREEMFLAKAGGQDVETPQPITRREKLLQGIIDNGGGGSSGGEGEVDTWLDGSPKEVVSELETVRSGIFYNTKGITGVDLPNLKTAEEYMFARCADLTFVNLPLVEYAQGSMFDTCSNLESVYMPKTFNLVSYMFYKCSKLRKVVLGILRGSASAWNSGCTALEIFDSAYQAGLFDLSALTSLKHLVVRAKNPTSTYESVATLSKSSYLANTQIANGNGYIYVPRMLLSDDNEVKDYRRATNWSIYAEQFRALEDYTVDGTVTGALDESKI